MIDATADVTAGRFKGMAVRYVEWELGQQGVEIVAPDRADVVCLTAVAAQEWECVRAALKRYGVEHRRQVRASEPGRHPAVVLGGQAAMCPAIFEPIVDVACVGEGRTFLRTMARDGVEAAKALPCAWVPGDTRPVVPDDEFPWDAPPTKGEDGYVRIYASRGCRKKCIFCQTGWQMAYAENEEAKLRRQFEALRRAGYKVNVVTNDAPALAFFDALNVEHFSASYSQTLAFLDQADGVEALKGKVKSIRFGVEAPSDRLRGWIGKPVPTAGLYEVTCRLLNAGIGVRWFMIAGIPGETDADYDQLRQVVTDIRHDAKKGTLQLSFTAFCPEPAAPLCIAPLTDDYHDRYLDFHHWFFGRMKTRRAQLFKGQGPTSRLKHAIGSMGCGEDELRRGWLDRDPPNWRVHYPLRDRVRTAYNVYAARAGLPIGVTHGG